MNIGTQSAVKEGAQQSGKNALKLNPTTAPIMGEARHKMIAETAYFLAEQRGFAGGHVLKDWLEAENQVNTLLTKQNDF